MAKVFDSMSWETIMQIRANDTQQYKKISEDFYRELCAIKIAKWVEINEQLKKGVA